MENAQLLSALITSIVNVGFAAVAAWFLLTRALPKIHEIFLAEIGAQRKAYSDEVKEIRREAREALAVVVAHCEKEIAKMDQILHSDLSDLTKCVTDIGNTVDEIKMVYLNKLIKEDISK